MSCAVVRVARSAAATRTAIPVLVKKVLHCRLSGLGRCTSLPWCFGQLRTALHGALHVTQLAHEHELSSSPTFLGARQRDTATFPAPRTNFARELLDLLRKQLLVPVPVPNVVGFGGGRFCGAPLLTHFDEILVWVSPKLGLFFLTLGRSHVTDTGCIGRGWGAWGQRHGGRIGDGERGRGLKHTSCARK